MHIIPVMSYNLTPKSNVKNNQSEPAFGRQLLNKNVITKIVPNKKYRSKHLKEVIIKTINNVKTNYRNKKYLTVNENLELPIHQTDIRGIKEIHKALENQPEIIAKIHLTQDSEGNLPVHFSDFDITKEICRALKDQSEVLDKISTIRNNKGKLPGFLTEYSAELRK